MTHAKATHNILLKKFKTQLMAKKVKGEEVKEIVYLWLQAQLKTLILMV